jgi:hypothetical protein
VINRQRDSLELLKEFIEAIPRAAVHVVRNGYSATTASSSSTTRRRCEPRSKVAKVGR